MSNAKDVEHGFVRPIAHDQYGDMTDSAIEHEEHALLSQPKELALQPGDLLRSIEDQTHVLRRKGSTPRWSTCLTYAATFAAGFATCLVFQAIFPSTYSSPQRSPYIFDSNAAAQDDFKSTVFHFPPAHPTNYETALFPPEVGYKGPTPTGDEPALIATAPSYPIHTGAAQLVGPSSLAGGPAKGKDGRFDIFRHWGNLSPWYTVPSSDFGLPDASPEVPEGCSVTGLHFLHRHGARYPTSSREGPEQMRYKLEKAKKQGLKWTAKGLLEFLNSWDFSLGNELLTPFGREQMYDLGITLRMKYGFLLQNFTQALPVFRTESQDRMVESARNFAVGFFGLPLEGKYLQSITYETGGVNNTLAPYMTCPNANAPGKSDRMKLYVGEWINVYLQDAAKRLQALVDGLPIGPRDAYNMQQLCAYETVALGYSKFCELFTEEEWEGFSYSMDLYFWYGHGYGWPLARAQGIGYIQELVARLTHTPISVHNSSTNATLDDNIITFPLHQPLYVDATHEVVVLNIITALNITHFADQGPLPSDHIPENRSFYSSKTVPFGTNLQFQLLSCASTSEPQIRLLINDGVAPLFGVEGCPRNRDGMCPVETFVQTQKKIISEADWAWACHGDWEVPPGRGWNTTTGDAPSREEAQSLRRQA